VIVTGVVSAASFQPGRLGVGSLATVFGSNLSGKAVQVTFDGISATLVYLGEKQINLQIPPGLGSKTSAQMVVTVDGVKSDPKTVDLAPLSPAIFQPGILNQSGLVNEPTRPVVAGNIVQIFMTGLTPPPGWKVTVKLHDVWIDPPIYAGPPGDPSLASLGMQQVNVRVPDHLQAMTTEVLVCTSSPASSEQVCSLPVPINVRR